MANTYNTIHADTYVPTALTGGPGLGGDNQALELGVKFSSSVAGSIIGVRFYRSQYDASGNANYTNTGTLWSSTGTKLGTITFPANEPTTTGWAYGFLTTPVKITAGTTYCISVWLKYKGTADSTTPAYYATSGGFSSAVTRAPLTAPVNAGVYDYYTSPGTAMPASTFGGTDYAIDPLFAQDAPGGGSFGSLSGSGSLSTSNPTTINATGAFGALAAAASASFLDLASDASSFGAVAASGAASSTNAATAAPAFGAFAGSASLSKYDPATEAAAFGALAASASLSALDATTATGAFGAFKAAASVSLGNGFVAVGQFGSFADAASLSALNSGTAAPAFGALTGAATFSATDAASETAAFGALAGTASASATNTAAAAPAWGDLASAATVTATNAGAASGTFGALRAFAQDAAAANLGTVISRPRAKWWSPRQQPSPDAQVVIDWDHPLTAGLVAAYLPSATPGKLVNLAGFGGDLITSGSPATGGTASGITAQDGTGSSGWVNTVPPPALQPSGAVSLYWRGDVLALASDLNSPPLFSCYHNNTNAAPYLAWGILHQTTSSQSNVTLYFNVAGTAHNTATVANSAPVGTASFLGAVTPGSFGTLYSGGKQIAQVAAPSGSIQYGATANIRVGCHVTAPTSFSNTAMALGLVWNRELSATEAAWLDAEPYAIFKPASRRLTVAGAIAANAVAASPGFGALAAAGVASATNGATAAAEFGPLASVASLARTDIATEAAAFGALASSAALSATDAAAASGAFQMLAVDATAAIGNGFIAVGRFASVVTAASASATNAATAASAFGAALASAAAASSDSASAGAAFGRLAAAGVVGFGVSASGTAAFGALASAATAADVDGLQAAASFAALAAAGQATQTNAATGAGAFAPVAAAAAAASGTAAFGAGAFGALLAASQIVVTNPVAATGTLGAPTSAVVVTEDTHAAAAFGRLSSLASVAMLNPSSATASFAALNGAALAFLGAAYGDAAFGSLTGSAAMLLHHPAISATVLVANPRRRVVVPAN